MGRNIASAGRKSAVGMDASKVAGTGLSSSLGDVASVSAKTVLALGAITVAATTATVAITKLAMAGSRFEVLRDAFEAMTIGMVDDSGKFIQAMKDASGQTLTSTAIMISANRALALIGRQSFGDFQSEFAEMVEFSTKASLAMGESVDFMFESLIRGIGRSSPLILDNLGIQARAEEANKKYATSIGRTADSLTFQEEKAALLQETMRQLRDMYGDVELDTDKLALSAQALTTQFVELKTVIGQALAPAVEIFVDLLGNWLTGAMGAATSASTKLAYGFVAVAVVIRATINAIVGAIRILYGAFQSLVTLSFDPFVDAVATTYGNFVATADMAWQKTEDIAAKSVREQVGNFQSGMRAVEDASDKKKSKLEKDLEKETERFKEEMAKRVENFKESLADMIFAHIDKRDHLIDDLADENADFEESMGDRVRDFDEAMEEMEDKHRKKVENIKEQIDDELEKQEEADEKRLEQLEKRLKEEQKALDRLERDESTRLQTSIARLKKNYEYEVALGKGSEEELFYQLQDRIEEEKAISKQHVKDLVGYKEEELERIKQEELARIEEEREEEAERLAELKEKLEEEVSEYEKALAKKEEVFKRETTRMKEEHDERVADLEERLQKEESILSLHYEDVAAVKDQAREDDITRLKRHFEEQRIEAEIDHKRKMVELVEKGTAEGSAYGGAIGGALAPELENIKGMMEEGGKTAGENFAKGIAKGAKDAAKSLITDFIDEIGVQVRAIPEYLRYIVLPKLGIVDEKVKKYFGVMQTGGVIPGPIGTPSPIMAHGGERIIPAGIGQAETTGGAGLTFEVNVGLYAGTETEKRNIARELYGALIQVAQSQDKTVKEFMEG